MTTFTGTSGDDNQTGTNVNDIFNYFQGGHDTLFGRGGDDVFQLDDEFESLDHISGGDGYDIIELDSYFGIEPTLRNATFRGIEEIHLFSGDYELNLADGNIAAGETLIIRTEDPFPGDAFNHRIDASAETDGHLIIYADTLGGADSINGGQLSDVIYAGVGEFAFVFANGGDDEIRFEPDQHMFHTNHLFGGDGFDRVFFDGDYSSFDLTSNQTAFQDIEDIELDSEGGAFTYNFAFNDFTLDSGQEMAIHANSADHISMDGSAESDGGSYLMYGGSGDDALLSGNGDDALRGRAGSDFLQGGNGLDSLTGGSGSDQFYGGNGGDFFIYNGASDSTGIHFDLIFDFDAAEDRFITSPAVTGVDHKITHGRLDTATFDADLEARVDAAHLAAHHAVLFKPNHGDHASFQFLVIDLNGTAGFQTDADLIIRLVGASHLGDLGPEDFGAI